MVAHHDQSGKTDGVYCDLCGTLAKDKFAYFSGKFDRVEVDRDSGKHGIVDIDRRCLDVDFCETCWGELKDRMLKNLERVDELRQKEKLKGNWSTSTQTGKKPIQNKQRLKP